MSVKLVRARSLAVLPRIAPFLLEDDDGAVTKQMLLKTLEHSMIEDSEALMLLVALDEEAEAGQEIKGFMIAYSPVSMNYVFIDQCWIESKISHLMNLSDSMVGVVKTWARNQGRSFIRMETKRDPRAITKRFGFLALSTTMQAPVDEPDEVIKEFSNGQEQRTKDDVNDERSSDDALKGAVRVSEREVGSNSGAVRRPESGSNDESVPGSTGAG